MQLMLCTKVYLRLMIFKLVHSKTAICIIPLHYYTLYINFTDVHVYICFKLPSLSFSLISIVADVAVRVVTGGSSADRVTVRSSSLFSTTLSLMISRLAHKISPVICPLVNTN